jgi:hypothetical protein
MEPKGQEGRGQGDARVRYQGLVAQDANSGVPAGRFRGGEEMVESGIRVW